ncbi:hypothetical protein GLI01_32980 [Gluconacetobacter liquefaciens]|uniref:DUF488 domain-containing protein n=1 Tax=Gluconacetobacter liquefaciens TaxID=89584 RepID=A0A370GE12_GLULI|nr:DUF488 domain-containing protein [Gluconacetobacter liquefaciens]MBB2184808.1 DUF488 domain-containing protein [Gluconacetobacter liquefaciens]RDI40233.1 uncharacterized protein YeaO (DUF488 family) [Gluconacetobacter liquefaciens]GEB39263.1 hypothetical protein GLI01_32980 [Gluconacetobacter liquefaciens]
MVREDHRSEIGLKRVYDAPEPGDGVRVLVDRLWPRGVRKDALKMDLWLKDVAPSPDLRHWFGHDPVRWEEFQARYRRELEAGNPEIAQLGALAGREKVTLLYAAHDLVHNHALVLRDFLRGA